MATILEYANEVAQYVGNAEVKEVIKANGVKKIGILVKQGSICPTVYVDQMYEDNIPVQQAAAMVMHIAEENKPREFDAEKYLDYEGYVKPRLRARLYNKTTPAEVKRSADRRGFKDLIIVPYVELMEMDGAIKVLKDHVEKWGVSEKEVIDTALKNSAEDTVVKDLFGMVQDLSGMEFPDVEDAPVVVSNEKGVCGASAILGLIPSLKKRYTKGFYVLPSSIHEVLVIPNNGDSSIEMYNDMVHDVNTTTVLPEEVLADNAFFFA